MRPDYCPIGNEPCQSLCDTPCSTQQRYTTDAMKVRQAVAQAVLQHEAKDEPVAWRTFDGEGGYDYRTYDMNENYANEWNERNPKHNGWVEPLYTAPPTQPEPVRDTEAHYKAVVEGVQKLFNDKRTQPAPVQEPVAWMEMVVANLVREGVNKHKARELAKHFYSLAQPALVQSCFCPNCEAMGKELAALKAQPEERNFCPRCGKRTRDLTTIHTCTPPQENT